MSSKVVIVILVLIIIIGALIGIGAYVFKPTIGGDEGPVVTATSRRGSGYQAVFLVNGQVYFGMTHGENRPYVKLTDVYYLQVNEQLQPIEEGAPQSPNVSLIKFGGELHGPLDEMRINREHILLIEDLRSDSRVVQAIEEFKRTQTGG